MGQNQDKVNNIVQKYQAEAQAKQAELQKQYLKEINQAKRASFKSVQSQLNELANSNIKKVPNKDVQKILSELSKIANKQVIAGYKKAGIKANAKISNIAIQNYNQKVQPKISGQVEKIQQRVNNFNQKW